MDKYKENEIKKQEEAMHKDIAEKLAAYEKRRTLLSNICTSSSMSPFGRHYGQIEIFSGFDLEPILASGTGGIRAV